MQAALPILSAYVGAVSGLIALLLLVTCVLTAYDRQKSTRDEADARAGRATRAEPMEASASGDAVIRPPDPAPNPMHLSRTPPARSPTPQRQASIPDLSRVAPPDAGPSMVGKGEGASPLSPARSTDPPTPRLAPPPAGASDLSRSSPPPAAASTLNPPSDRGLELSPKPSPTSASLLKSPSDGDEEGETRLDVSPLVSPSPTTPAAPATPGGTAEEPALTTSPLPQPETAEGDSESGGEPTPPGLASP